MPMPLTLPLSVAPAFLPFLWRRGFTFLRERRRSLTFLVDLRLLISSSFRLVSVPLSLLFVAGY